MARARNLKPGFFRNADLVELPFEARLLFAGLWTLSDREGRMEDRPKQIKMELFPADNIDCDALLNMLQSVGMIERYTVENKNYIQVINFSKHQNPHRDEKPSLIPCKHSAGTVQAQCKDNAKTIAIGLIPSSLIPDSLNTDLLIPEKPKPQPPVASDAGRPDCPHEKIITLYHELLPASPRIKDWTPARAASLKARWNEETDRQTLDYWKSLFEYIAGIPFLTGKVASNGRKPFVISLDWLVKPDNFAKVREGRYEDRAV